MKKFIGIFIAILLMLSTFAGCGSASKQESATADYGGKAVAPAAGVSNEVKDKFSSSVSADMDDGNRSGTENGEA